MSAESPACLYKFLSDERMSFFTDGLLRFSQPSILNDPFECVPQLSFSVISHLLAIDSGGSRAIEVLTKERSDRVLLPYLAALIKRLDSELGILSLSERWNSTLMWSHYAQNHRGFCVGFDRESDFFLGTAIWGPAEQVKYATQRVLTQARAVSRDEVLQLLLTKSDEWSYEREVRLIRPLADAASTLAIPGSEEAKLFAIPLNAVKEIYVGHRADSALRQELAAAGKQLGVEVYEASPSLSGFGIRRWSNQRQRMEDH